MFHAIILSIAYNLPKMKYKINKNKNNEVDTK